MRRFGICLLLAVLLSGCHPAVEAGLLTASIIFGSADVEEGKEADSQGPEPGNGETPAPVTERCRWE